MKKLTLKTNSAFSLIEVTLALGVAGFCLIAIFGLLPVSLQSNQAAIEQTAANGIVTAVASDLRATPSTSPPGTLSATSKQYSVAIPANPVASLTTLPPLYFTADRQFSTTKQTWSRYRVTISFLPTAARSATQAVVKVSWPAAVDPATGTPTGTVQTFVALDRN